MIYIAHAGPAAAVVGPGNLRPRVNGQRKRIEGSAAAGDRHVGRGGRVTTRLRTGAGRGARSLSERFGHADTENHRADGNDDPLHPKGPFRQSRARTFYGVVVLQNGRHNFFLVVVAGGK